MNQLLNVNDFKKKEWISVIDEMHDLMKVKRSEKYEFPHCTDRRSLFGRAEIETFKHWEYPWTIKHGNFQPGNKVLDCGCGRGFLQIYLALKGINLTSVDISTLKPKAVRKFWELCKKTGLPLKENKTSQIPKLAKRYGTDIDFHVLNMATLPFDSDSFDSVYSISVLEHMALGGDEKSMKEMARVLKPGGRLLVTVDFSPEKIPRVSYDAQDISRLIKISGLEIVGDASTYEIPNWKRHVSELMDTFQKPNVEVSTAGFVLEKAAK